MYTVFDLELYKVRLNLKLNYITRLFTSLGIMNLLRSVLLTCSHLSMAAATILLISCAGKMTLMASCARGFSCLPVTLDNDMA